MALHCVTNIKSRHAHTAPLALAAQRCSACIPIPSESTHFHSPRKDPSVFNTGKPCSSCQQTAVGGGGGGRRKGVKEQGGVHRADC